MAPGTWRPAEELPYEVVCRVFDKVRPLMGRVNNNDTGRAIIERLMQVELNRARLDGLTTRDLRASVKTHPDDLNMIIFGFEEIGLELRYKL
jgi:hypothetical protein